MPKYVNLNLAEVEQNPERANIKYGNKSVVCKMYSMKRSTLEDWLKDMRSRQEFAHGVINPTHRIVLIHLDTFEAYFKWLAKTRYTR